MLERAVCTSEQREQAKLGPSQGRSPSTVTCIGVTVANATNLL